jgi:uncharacterized protein (TIGR03435 family)
MTNRFTRKLSYGKKLLLTGFRNNQLNSSLKEELTIMIRLICGASLIVLLTSGAFGQSAQAPRAFEVASVKPHAGPLSRVDHFSSSGPRATLEGYPPIGLVREAYGLENYQVSFAVPQRDDEYIYYDIFAKAEGDGAPTRNEFRQMLQTLLAERFKLKVHRGTKEMPVYALVVGKNGPKFKESAPDASSAANDVGVNGRNQYMTASKATMEDLVQTITNILFVDRPILDKTGLTGTYAFKLEATPEFRINNNPESSDISVFTAVQEQLGLKLEAQKAPVEVLVVDHIEKPSGN